MSFDVNGGAPHRGVPNVANPRGAPVSPQTPRRPFTNEDYLKQREMLIFPSRWDDQYTIPARPWSATAERSGDDALLAIQQEDYEAVHGR